MSLFNNDFLASIRKNFQSLNDEKELGGIKAIVEGFEAWSNKSDKRWLAYMLATAFHETNATMQPVKEAYWLSETWRKNHLSYYPYYGRGYVQLTHRENYQKAGDAIGVNLVDQLDRALEPDIAANVMFIGMDKGWFRGDNQGRHTLSRYFSATANDPVGARNIINGKETKIIHGQPVTVADMIAGYYTLFLEALGDGAQQVNTQTVNLVASGTISPISKRFAEEAAILLPLAESLDLRSAMQTLLDKRAEKYPASHPRYWAIIDFDKKSDTRRLFIFDIEEGNISSYLCAHGEGSDPSNSGYATLFSNVDGSHMSSLGVYLCSETYFGSNGYSMRLDGLDESNSNARQRSIVIHPSNYVSDEFAAENHRVGRSYGCPAVDAQYSQSIIERLKLGSLLMAWKS